jgi:hypothetical protein
MEKFSEEITYTPVVSNHSSYVMRNIAPQGSNSLTLSSAGVVGPVEFILPPAVMNLSKSYLEFGLTIPASTAGSFNFINGNLNTIINRIVCYSSSTNAVICDVSNFNLFSQLTSSNSHELNDYLTKPYLSGALPAAVTETASVQNISKCNTATANLNISQGGLVTYLNENFYLQRRQFYVGADTTATGLNISLPLEGLKHTIFSVNRNLYFPENIICQIYFNNTDNFAFQSEDATAFTTIVSVNAGSTISNLNILLAQEQNLAIVSQTIDRVMKGPGISLPFTYPSVTRQTAGGNNFSTQLQLTKAYGQRILGLITAAFDTTALRTNSHLRGAINSYNTFINSVPLKYTAGIDCAKSDDYTLNKPHMKGSVIQTMGEYTLGEWFHFDSFVGEKPLWKVDEEQTDIDGLDVTNASSTWQLQTAATTNYTWVTCILGQKILTITSSGAMVM